MSTPIRSDVVPTLLRELRFGARALRRNPPFALAAVVTLALGIGATAALYTVLDAVVLRPLPYAEPDRLIHLASRAPLLGEDQRWGLSQAGYQYFRDEAASIESIGAFGSGEVTLSGDFDAERARSGQITASLHDVLRMAPYQGRLFREEDNLPGSAGVVILGHDFWRSRFGGENVVGRTVEINSRSVEVIGVMAPGVHLPAARVDVWMPITMDPAAPPINAHWIASIARLRPGVSVESARTELTQLTGRFEALFPEAYGGGFMPQSGFFTEVITLHDEVVGGMRRVLVLMLGAVCVVLLIAVANVANLFLVRTEARRRETTVRSAMGAARSHLAVHYFAESLLVGLAAAVIGVIIAYGGVRMLLSIAPADFPRLHDIGVSAPTLGIAALLGVASGFVFALIPLAQAKVRFELLREGRGLTASRRRRAARASLIVGQVALALVLLAASGLLMQSFRNLRAVDPGFDADGVLTFQLVAPAARYPTPEATFAFLRELHDRLSTLPGVQAVGAVDALPMAMGDNCFALFIEDRPLAPGDQPPCVRGVFAAPGYFEAMRIQVRGGAPDWLAMERGDGGVVVTRALADRLWPGDDPIGKGLRGNGWARPFYRVVGVSDDVRATGLDQPPLEAVYYPLLAMEGAPLWGTVRNVSLVLRTTGAPPLALVEPVRRTIADMDRNIPLGHVRSMTQVVAQSEAAARVTFTMLLLVTAAAVALLLSAIGIYGVIAYLVAQRTNEIAIRMALGARAGQVRARIVGQSLAVVGIGLALGVVGAVITSRLLGALLFDVSPSDPRVLGGVALLLVAIAAVASFIPAWRAASTHPASVLRSD